MRTLLFFLLLPLAFAALAAEPYKVDVTQEAFSESVSGIDHLEPVQGNIPEFYYLAQFIQLPSFHQGNYLVVSRTKEGRYLLRTGTMPKDGSVTDKPKMGPEVQIPESLAAVIYEIWVNALLEVRYDRKAYRGLDGTRYTFSTYVRALGWMHGGIWSPDNDAPPTWMVETGGKLLAFARDPKRDPKTLETELANTRDKLFRHLKTQGKH
jgi:hypothetical protein